MARPQGIGVLADMTACKALDPNPKADSLSISILLCIHLHWCYKFLGTLFKPPCLFFFSNFSFFLPVQERPPRRKSQNETLTAYRRPLFVSTWLFPVSCLFHWGIIQHFLSKRGCCHQTTLLVAHWPNSAVPVGLAPLLLQLALFFLFIPCSVVGFSVSCFYWVNIVFVNGIEADTLPLCCLQQWSVPHIW